MLNLVNALPSCVVLRLAAEISGEFLALVLQYSKSIGMTFLDGKLSQFFFFAFLSLFPVSLLAEVGLIYDSSHPESAEKFEKFTPAISFTNEAEIWHYLRDKIIIAFHEDPDRVVVSAGLQQSLELAFSGVDKIVFIDGHPNSVASFALISNLARESKSSKDFYDALQKKLVKIEYSGESIDSYTMDFNSVDEFINLLKAYGEEGFRRFRKASLSGGLKAYLQDVSKPKWGRQVLKLSGNRAPSVIYLSNIRNHLQPDDGSFENLRSSLETLSLEKSQKTSFFGWGRQREQIHFGSWIVETSYQGFSPPPFSVSFNPFWFAPGFNSNYVSKINTKKITFANEDVKHKALPAQDLSRFQGKFVRVQSRLDKRVIKGFVLPEPQTREDSRLRIMTEDGEKIYLNYDPRLYELQEDEPPESVKVFVENPEAIFKVHSNRSETTYILKKVRVIDIIPEKDGIVYRFSFEQSDGEKAYFNFNPTHHKILSIKAV